MNPEVAAALDAVESRIREQAGPTNPGSMVWRAHMADVMHVTDVRRDLDGGSPPPSMVMRPSVTYDVFPPKLLPVGHTSALVTKVEFSVSRRHWLRALGTNHHGHRSWLGIDPPRAPWLAELIEDVLPRLPEARRR